LVGAHPTHPSINGDESTTRSSAAELLGDVVCYVRESDCWHFSLAIVGWQDRLAPAICDLPALCNKRE
jgi:hypothetical protein